MEAGALKGVIGVPIPFAYTVPCVSLYLPLAPFEILLWEMADHKWNIFLNSILHFNKLIEPQEAVLGTPIYSQLVRNTDGKLQLVTGI